VAVADICDVAIATLEATGEATVVEIERLLKGTTGEVTYGDDTDSPGGCA
jgi:uncharacterized membrane protein YcaP (DUF421 family)